MITQDPSTSEWTNGGVAIKENELLIQAKHGQMLVALKTLQSICYMTACI